MTFTGDEGDFITLSEGAALTSNYRNSASAGATKGHYIGKSKLNQLLAQAGCVGIRVYYGQSTTGSKELVIVGVDANQNDILPTSGALILDKTVPCPSGCSSNNGLNS